MRVVCVALNIFSTTYLYLFGPNLAGRIVDRPAVGKANTFVVVMNTLFLLSSCIVWAGSSLGMYISFRSKLFD